MRRTTAALLAIALFPLVSPCLYAQGTFPLTYRDCPGEATTELMMSRGFFGPQQEKPGTVKDVPAGLSKNLTWFSVDLGKRSVLMLFDGATNPKLYLDTDLDGSLADEKPFELPKEQQVAGPVARLFRRRPPSQPVYGPITLKSGAGDPEVKVRVRSYGGRYIMISPAGVWSGTVKVAGKEHRLSVVDANYDGRLDGVLSMPPEGQPITGEADTLAFDFNGNGAFEPGYYEANAEMIPLPRMLKVGEDYYSVTVAADGSSVTLAKVTPKFGTLDVGTKDATLLVWSDNGSHMLTGTDGRWRVPAGTYMTRMVTLNRTDAAGDTWMLRCYGNVGKLARFEVRPDETVSVRVGTPLTATTAVQSGGEDDPEVYISLSLTGQSGERYTPGAMKNNRMTPAPGLEILDEAGKALGSGKFEYG